METNQYGLLDWTRLKTRQIMPTQLVTMEQVVSSKHHLKPQSLRKVVSHKQLAPRNMSSRSRSQLK